MNHLVLTLVLIATLSIVLDAGMLKRTLKLQLLTSPDRRDVMTSDADIMTIISRRDTSDRFDKRNGGMTSFDCNFLPYTPHNAGMECKHNSHYAECIAQCHGRKQFPGGRTRIVTTCNEGFWSTNLPVRCS